MREAGILMHITSLPGAEAIGTLGQEAYAFADFLQAAGMKIWQVLPIGPVGYGNSPYQSPSTFAGNPMLISLEALKSEGLLNAEIDPVQAADAVDYTAAAAAKEQLLRLAFEQSGDKLAKEMDAFAAAHPWAADYALFQAIKTKYPTIWTSWPDRLKFRRDLPALQAEYAEEIRYQLFVQTLFFKQWFALKRYCNERGISLFGDMPIYVAEDSADTWTHPEVFQLDKNRIPKRVAGVPPDYFSADGQLWGNPLYRWTSLRLHGFGWWVERMRAMGEMFDIIRIDHFIGFANYYSIPHGAPNARGGKWVIGPGKALFRTLSKALPNLRIVAEDLGCVTDRVRKLISFTGYPGMRVAEFGFDGGGDSQHRPDRYVPNCAAYTGTHDNDTVLGWVKHASEESLREAKACIGFETEADAPAAFVRAVLQSNANIAMLAMQDILGLDSDCRMNLPGTTGNNWRWRMLPGAATDAIARNLHDLVVTTKRGNLT